uniref:Transposase n=1 Tax=Candidatus Kentrum sp. SD TaxID=2126332 RepID=A0A450Z733_9GAMM|nr:MAG: hypothetical protein BECKSD772F_GA0070984_11893 [Candidatus Kentron sp. SD]VFK49596.1 MAG: hypothetical protein BECKSD772E_GA0070983_11973 [Candidatus Kentron sp. SD]VFK81035.1 MAG: hypothetical protein BECKSD772D_GA0070982_12043 [Candidatus Kentron sp. SD]
MWKFIPAKIVAQSVQDATTEDQDTIHRKHKDSNLSRCWGIKVFFLYAPRRVNCPKCGIHVENMPWVRGKHRLTKTYAWFLAGWAKRLSWKEVAEVFHTTWDHVFNLVEMAVTWGCEHRELSGIEARRR